MTDWRKPYRSQDESGSDEAAGTVGYRWVTDLARRLHDAGDPTLQLQTETIAGGGSVTVLYRGTSVIACATTIRDPLNWSILIRWAAPGVA